MAEAAIFHNLEGVGFKSANPVVQYLSSNYLYETLPHFINTVIDEFGRQKGRNSMFS